jgi:hypothetical protein
MENIAEQEQLLAYQRIRDALWSHITADFVLPAVRPEAAPLRK